MLDCNDLTFLSLNTNKVLKKAYTKNDLINMAIDEWIPYFECHKCGRWDYCKFAKKHPANPDRSIEIKCGVVRDVIINYFNVTFKLATTLDKESRQAYLNAGFYLSQYIFQSETYIGLMMQNDMIEYMGKYGSSTFAFTKKLSDLLDKQHAEMAKVPFLNSMTSKFFVEGESERIIVSNFINSNSVEVIDYGGKGRMTYPKMEYLFKTYHEKGYKIYVHSDLDGINENQNINKMITKSILQEKNTFLFKHDLETSYPIEWLHEALLEFTNFSIDLEQFKFQIPTNKSIVNHIKDTYKLEIPKIKIAEFVSRKINLGMLNSADFIATELGKFLLFCQKASVQE